MRLKRFMVTFLFIVLITSCILAQKPQQHWQQYATPEEAGFSSEKLAQAKALYDSLSAAAFLIIYDGKVLASWGDVTRRYMCHSVRKSLLSALYGIYVDDGVIDPDKTLSDLKIDDKDTLTETEKAATIRDLLKARSGVYHPAAYETASMKARRPKRGSHKRNEFWYYNNWDFNALGTIFEQETGTDIFVAFKNRIAEPLQMEDYRVMDGYHHLEPENSIHPAYPFRMSARDLARFGLLFLREGVWNGKRIIPKEWIKESTTPYSKSDNRGGGYAYLWWISGDFKNLGMYSARGYGGHIVAVVPGANMVIVQRVDTYLGKQQGQNNRLLRMIFDAKVAYPMPNPKLISLQNNPSYQRPKLIQLDPNVLKKYVVKDLRIGLWVVNTRIIDDELLLDSPNFGKYKLLASSNTTFVIEDFEQYLLFEFDNNENPIRMTLQQSSAVADLYSTIMEKGIEAAAKQYQRMKGEGILIGENELDKLGYQLLGMKKIKQAIEIFKLNVEAYPESYNVYDSLGEAYMINGNDSLAVKNYKKSLELNPRNTIAETMIRRIRKK
jgi:CubicO group peptidase (beta-lactamase class C family)